MGYHPRGNTSVFYLLQVSRYFYTHGILLPPHWKRYFYSPCFLFFNFPKIYFEIFGIKSDKCYKIVIWMFHSNLHVIVNTKTFQSKRISCRRAINKVKWELKCRWYECLQRRKRRRMKQEQPQEFKARANLQPSTSKLPSQEESGMYTVCFV